ncbi:MAG: hypothetical protein AAF653_07590, partial [Chloroflexota bacterium]
ALLLLWVPLALAHGVVITLDFAEDTGEMTLAAAFDTGEVLDEAQVAIFAPSDIANPWQTGTTDADGVYTFTPDFTDEGEWAVQVRKAGHGGVANVMIDASMAPVADAAPDSAAEPVAVDSGRIVISGDAVFEVTGDVVITTTGSADVQAAGNASLTEGFTPAQIIIMSASIIWGALGTALYFSGRNAGQKQGANVENAH